LGTTRNIFDRVAKLYDEIRPGYPKKLIEDVISISNIPEDGWILEVGCGTGQATIPFAERGYHMVCLDPSKEMVSIAKKKLGGYPKVRIIQTTFEEWQPGAERFDLVVSATAFHWVRAEIGYRKAAEVLKESGHIAIFSNLHPTPYKGFFEEVQTVYRSVVPEWGVPDQVSTEKKIGLVERDINKTGLFEKVVVKKYHWSRSYTADQYIKLLSTYSNHQTLDGERREKLFRGVKALIEKRYGGRVRRPYLSVLFVARKLGQQGVL